MLSRGTTLLPLLLALAAAIPVYLAASIVAAGDQLPLWLPAVLFGGAHVVMRSLSRMDPFDSRWSLASPLVALGFMIVSIRLAVFPDAAFVDSGWLGGAARGLAFVTVEQSGVLWAAVLLAICAWSWGRLRHDDPISKAYLQLRVGTVVLAGVTLVSVLAGSQAVSEPDLVRGALAFYGTTLIAIGGLQLRAWQVGDGRPGGTLWVALSVLPVLGIVVLGLAAADLAAGDLAGTLGIVGYALQQVAAGLLYGLSQLAVLLSYVIFGLLFLLTLILKPVIWIIEWLLSSVSGGQADGGVSDFLESAVEPGSGELGGVPASLRYAGLAATGAGLCLLLFKLGLPRRTRSGAAGAAERTSVFSWSELAGVVRSGPRARRRRPTAADPFARLRGDGTLHHTLRIRECYLRFQGWGATMGRQRRQSETAGEYGQVLGRRLINYPELNTAVDELTRLYDRARYSGTPATRAEARAAEQAVGLIERFHVVSVEAEQ